MFSLDALPYPAMHGNTRLVESDLAAVMKEVAIIEGVASDSMPEGTYSPALLKGVPTYKKAVVRAAAADFSTHKAVGGAERMSLIALQQCTRVEPKVDVNTVTVTIPASSSSETIQIAGQLHEAGDGGGTYEKAWTVCPTPATFASLSSSKADDTVWGVTMQGMVYVRVPTTDTSTGEAGAAEPSAEEGEDAGAAAVKFQSPYEKRMNKGMDESSSDEDTETTEGGAARGVSTDPFHAAWTLVVPSEVDHSAYQLRGKKVPDNIVPHQLFRHVAAAGKECVWAITNDSDDAGRIVMREGFDPKLCVKGKKATAIANQHRAGDKWADYSDDVVPMPESYRKQGGWFPVPTQQAGESHVPQVFSEDAFIESEAPPTSWVTHPTNCPFLASDSRQYGNALVGTQTSRAIAMTSKASEESNSAIAPKMVQNPFIEAMLALRNRQFVTASVGKDGSLWAVTEEEVITKLVISDTSITHPSDGAKRVWSRLWYREDSSIDSPGSRWIEATELFDEIEQLNPQDPFAVSAIATSRYQRDQAVASVPKFRILSLAHIVQNQLFAIIQLDADEDPSAACAMGAQYDHNRSGLLFQRVGITAVNPTGTHWRRVCLESELQDRFANLELIKIRSIALAPCIDRRHYEANHIDGQYEADPDLYSRHLAFNARLAAAVVVSADGNRMIDVLSAINKHLATQPQSATFSTPDGSLYVGDLLPLPLVLPERAKLSKAIDDVPITRELVVVDEATVAEHNSLGVGLNRFDTSLRTLHPNVTDPFVDGLLLSVEKQRALNPHSVKYPDPNTTAVSYGVQDDRKEAFSSRSVRGVVVPADLADGLRDKLQILRHRSSVPVADSLHGSLLSLVVTRTNTDDGADVTDLVATIAINVNEEPETSDDENTFEEEGQLAIEGEGIGGGRRCMRTQFAILTVWVAKQPMSGDSPILGRYLAVYCKLHIKRYLIQRPSVGLGLDDCIATFTHRLTGCDLNADSQKHRFQRATEEQTTLWYYASNSSKVIEATIGRRHIRAQISIEFFNGQMAVPLTSPSMAHSSSALEAFRPSNNIAFESAEDGKGYATRQTRTIIAFHPSDVRILGLKPAELASGPIASQQLATIVVTYRASPLSHNGTWQQGYGDPKVVLSLPLPRQLALRDLSSLFCRKLADGTNSDVLSAKYLQQLEGLRSLLSPAGAEQAMLYISNASNVVTVSDQGRGLQIVSGAHIGFGVNGNAFPLGTLDITTSVGISNANQEVIAVVCPLTIEAITGLTIRNEHDINLSPVPPQLHVAAPTDCSPFLVTSVGCRTTSYQQRFYGHPYLDPLRVTLAQPQPSEDSVWYPFVGNHADPSYVRIKDVATILHQGAEGTKTVSARTLGTVEISVRGSLQPLVSTASGVFTVDEVAPEGVFLSFAGHSNPVNIVSTAGNSEFPIGGINNAIIHSKWVLTKADKKTPFTLLDVTISPDHSGGTHSAAFLGLPCITTQLSAPKLRYQCAAAGSCAPLSAEELLASRTLRAPLLGPSDPSDKSAVRSLDFSSLLAYPCEWSRIAEAGHEREMVLLDGDDRLMDPLTIAVDAPISVSAFVEREGLFTQEAAALKAKLEREANSRGAAISLLQSVYPRTLDSGVALWRHHLAETDQKSQARHDDTAQRALIKYLRERPLRWEANPQLTTEGCPLRYNTKLTLNATGPQAPMAGRKLLLCAQRPKRPTPVVTAVADIDTIMADSAKAPLPFQCDLIPIHWEQHDRRIPNFSEGSAVWELLKSTPESSDSSDDFVRDGDLVKIINYTPPKPRYSNETDTSNSDEVAYLVPPMVKSTVTVWRIRVVRHQEVEEVAAAPIDETPVQRAIRERAEIRSKIVFAGDINKKGAPTEVTAAFNSRRGTVIAFQDEFELVHPSVVDAKAIAGSVVERQPDKMLGFSLDNMTVKHAATIHEITGALESRPYSAGPANYTPVVTEYSRWKAQPVELIPSKYSTPFEATEVKFAIQSVMNERSELAAIPLSVFGLDAFAKVEIVMKTVSGQAVPSTTSSEDATQANAEVTYPHHVVSISIEGRFVHALPLGKLGCLTDGGSAGPQFRIMVEQTCGSSPGPMAVETTGLDDETKQFIATRPQKLPQMHKDATTWTSLFEFDGSTTVLWASNSAEHLEGNDIAEASPAPNQSLSSATGSCVTSTLVPAEVGRFNSVPTSAFATALAIKFGVNLPIAIRPTWPAPIGLPLAFSVQLPTASRFCHTWADSSISIIGDKMLTGPGHVVFPWCVMGDIVKQSRPTTAIAVPTAALTEEDSFKLKEAAAQKAHLQLELKQCDKHIRSLFDQKAKMPNASRAQQSVIQSQIDELSSKRIPKLLVDLAALEQLFGSEGQSSAGAGMITRQDSLRVAGIIERIYEARIDSPGATLVVEATTTNSSDANGQHTFAVAAVDAATGASAALVRAHPSSLYQTLSTE